MTVTRVRDLNTIHVGAIASVDGRVGRLTFGVVPNGAGASSWYLIIPMAAGPFDEAALSLQWAQNETVHLIAMPQSAS